MSKKHFPFPSKNSQRRQLRAIKKYATGDYGIGVKAGTEPGFTEKAVLKDGLDEVYLEDKH